EDGRSGTDAGAVHRLLSDGQRLVPGILDCEITEITTRARPGSPDDLALVGRVDDGCIVSTGYSGTASCWPRSAAVRVPNSRSAAAPTGCPRERSTPSRLSASRLPPTVLFCRPPDSTTITMRSTP